MSIRKDRLFTQTLLFVAHLMQNNYEMNPDLQETQVVILKAATASETPVVAESRSTEPQTITNGATWGDPQMGAALLR